MNPNLLNWFVFQKKAKMVALITMASVTTFVCPNLMELLNVNVALDFRKDQMALVQVTLLSKLINFLSSHLSIKKHIIFFSISSM